jgi:protease I
LGQPGIQRLLPGLDGTLVRLEAQAFVGVAVLFGDRAGTMETRDLRDGGGRDHDSRNKEEDGQTHGSKVVRPKQTVKRSRNPTSGSRLSKHPQLQERPMAQTLNGKKIAVLATDGVEQIELLDPVKALKQAGAEVEIVSIKSGQIQGFDHLTPDQKIGVDKTLDETDASVYDGLLLPGGVANPDQLRGESRAVAFVRAFFEAGKPVAAICHAPWLLIEAGVVEGRTLTGFKTIRTDLTNAGANVVDEEVVVDQGLVTSRSPDDLPAFNAKMIEEFAEGRHREQAQAAETSGSQLGVH